MESIWYCCNKPISHLDFSLSKSPKVKVDCLRLKGDLSTWERRDPFDGNLPEVDSRAGRPTWVSKWWVKLIAFVCQHIYIPGCALMERLWVEGYWSPSRLPSGGLGGSCVAPHNLITSYHRSQHIDSNLDNNLNNILDNNVYMCKVSKNKVHSLNLILVFILDQVTFFKDFNCLEEVIESLDHK